LSAAGPNSHHGPAATGMDTDTSSQNSSARTVAMIEFPEGGWLTAHCA
jgi:hypothetical protein